MREPQGPEGQDGLREGFPDQLMRLLDLADPAFARQGGQLCSCQGRMSFSLVFEFVPAVCEDSLVDAIELAFLLASLGLQFTPRGDLLRVNQMIDCAYMKGN